LKLIRIENVQPGMILGMPLRDEKENILLNQGVQLSERYINRLKELGFQSIYTGGDPDTEDILIEDIIPEHRRAIARKAIKHAYLLTDRAIKDFKFESVSTIQKNLESPKFQNVFKHIPLLDEVHNIIGDMVDDILSNDMLTGLNSIKTHDNYTYNHSIDVAITSLLIGKKLNLNVRQLSDLAEGCMLHDIGKIFIDNTILNKPGKLTVEEYERMKEHPTLGYFLLRDKGKILSNHVAYQHHERQDGTGYPRGLKGTNTIGKKESDGGITLFGEIAAVADIHDAMISDRVYRKGLMPDEVIKILRNLSGIHLNKEILEKFLKVIPIFPVGTNVLILTGRYQDYGAIVSKINEKNLSRPVIRILYDNKKNHVEPFELDLTINLETKIKSIA